MRWRIYYGDGSTYSGRGGAPELAPGRLVQVIVQKDDGARGYSLLEGVDFYWWADRWHGSERTGFDQYLFDKPRGWKACLAGSLMRDGEQWHEIMKRAARDAEAGTY